MDENKKFLIHNENHQNFFFGIMKITGISNNSNHKQVFSL